MQGKNVTKRMQEAYDKIKDNPEQLQELKRFQEQPELIYQSTEAGQKAFLRGFFDANGSIFIDEVGHFILSIRSKNAKKIDVAHQLLKKFNIQSFVFHGQNPEKISEPSRLLIVGFPDVVDFDTIIGMEHLGKKDRFRDALVNFLEVEGLMDAIE